MTSSTSVSTVAAAHPGVPNNMPDAVAHRRLIAAAVNRHNQAKFNCTIDVTLAANTGATKIADNRIGYSSAVTPLMAMTRSAALAIAAGIWFDGPMGQVAATTATIVAHHTSSSALDQTIRFGILG